MKKLLLSAIVSLLLAGSARANSYSDETSPYGLLSQDNPTYTGQFTLAGYNPAAETITSAAVEFTFLGLRPDSFKIVMGGDIFTHQSFFGALVVDSGLGVNAWGILDSTGVLSYTVSLTGHSKWLALIEADLTAETTSRSVPDAGATSILLGLGVVGILGVKRRFASVA